LAVSPEPERRSHAAPRKGSCVAGRARVERELLAETNGPDITSELFIIWRGVFILLPCTSLPSDYHGVMPRMKTTKPRLDRVMVSKTESQRENSGDVDTLARIRRGLAQARRGEGQLVDEVFDKLEQEA
jgi:hypothetical protein